MNFLTLLLLVIAFVLSALTYYRINPERVVVSLPFFFMATPLVLFIAFLAISATAIPTSWSVIALLVAFATLLVAMWRARWLLAQGR
ncbi:MAG: hypothetical protein ABI369_06945 [Acetobacteraceae bacterium]